LRAAAAGAAIRATAVRTPFIVERLAALLAAAQRRCSAAARRRRRRRFTRELVQKKPQNMERLGVVESLEETLFRVFTVCINVKCKTALVYCFDRTLRERFRQYVLNLLPVVIPKAPHP
jgi:hypothetical protein